MSKGRIIAGVDIGTEKICTVIASRAEDSDKINVIGVASTKSAGMRKSQIVDLEEVINATTDSVEAAERMAGYTLNDAFVSVSGSHIASQNSKGVVAVAEPDGEIVPDDVERVLEAARAISLPSSLDIIHVIPRDYIVDSQSGIKDPIGMTGVRLEAEGHIITGSNTAIKNISKVVSELGINVNGLVFSGLASSYSVLSETEKELGVVLVDIGGGTTCITAYVEGAIAHSSVIPVGAKNITNDLAIGMRISLSNAELVKLHLSNHQKPFAPPKETKASDISKLRKSFDDLDLNKLGIKEETSIASKKALIEGIIKPRLKEIFSLVGQQLKDAGVLGNTPAGIVLTGGGARTISIVEIAKRTLSMPARIGEPKGLSGLVDELSSPEFATSTGLIQYGLKHTPAFSATSPKIDFLSNIKKIPVRGTYDKIINLVKSLLP